MRRLLLLLPSLLTLLALAPPILTAVDLMTRPDGSGHDLIRELRVRRHAFPGIVLSG